MGVIKTNKRLFNYMIKGNGYLHLIIFALANLLINTYFFQYNLLLSLTAVGSFIVAAIIGFNSDPRLNKKTLLKVIVYCLFPIAIPSSFITSQLEISNILWLLVSFLFIIIFIYELRCSTYSASKNKLILNAILVPLISIFLSYIMTLLIHNIKISSYLATLICCLCLLKPTMPSENIKFDAKKESLLLILILCICLTTHFIFIKLPSFQNFSYLIHTLVIVAYVKPGDRNFVRVSGAMVSLMAGCIAGIMMQPINNFTPFGIDAIFLTTIILFCFIKPPVIFKATTPYAKIKIIYNEQAERIELYSDNVLHGIQYIDKEKILEPNSYYCIEGPFGQLMKYISIKNKRPQNMAVIGLGTGSIASYGQKGQEITFYEIDQTIADIASNGEYFTYLKNTAAETKIVIGDARNTLEKAPNHDYGLIVCDAYFGGDIPNKLLTYEAIKLYLSKLKEDGVLCIHISSKKYDIAPQLTNLLSNLNLVVLGQEYDPESNDTKDDYVSSGLLASKLNSQNKLCNKINDLRKLLKWLVGYIGITMEPNLTLLTASNWIIAARDESYLSDLIQKQQWKKLTVGDNEKLITDESIGYNQFKLGNMQ